MDDQSKLETQIFIKPEPRIMTAREMKIEEIKEKARHARDVVFKWAFWTSVVYFILFVCPSPSWPAENAAAPAGMTAESIMSAAQAGGEMSGQGILRMLFGSVADTPFASQNTSQDTPKTAAVAEFFMILNASLLALGTLYLTYNTVAGIAQTAQDGEFLGKRFSTLWVPVRLVAGVASLVPIFKGYAASQLVILYMASMGVGIANLATDKVRAALLSDDIVYDAPIPQQHKFVRQVYDIALCTSALSVNPENASQFDIKNGNFGPCGRVENATLRPFQNLYKKLSAKSDMTVYSYIQGDIETAQGVEATVTSHHFLKDADLSVLEKEYRADLLPTMRSPAVKLPPDDGLGFIGLGSYYSSLASASSKSAARNFPEVSVKVDHKKIMMYSLANETPFEDIFVEPNTDTNDSLAVKPESESALIAAIKSTLTDWGRCDILFGGFKGISECSDNTLVTLKHVGDNLVGQSAAALAVAFGIQGAAEGVINSPVGAIGGLAAGVTKGFGGIIITLLEVTTFFGVMLSYYLPLLPFIAWIGAIISWLTVVVEGVIAAPLWSFTHLDADGEGMGNKAQHGYMFALNVLLRPVLMVAGFVFSVLLVDVAGKVFLHLFPLAVRDGGISGGYADLLGFVVVIAVFFTTSVMIVNLCVSLIHEIPDSVLNWVGAQTKSSQVGSATSGRFTEAAVGMQAMGGKMAGGFDISKVMENSRKSRTAQGPAESKNARQNREDEK